MTTKNEYFLKEIQEKGGLTDYKTIVINLIQELENHNCKISCRYDICSSSYEHNYENNTKRIMISLKCKKKPIHIIWDILHEIGHLCFELKGKSDNSLNKEIQAWKYAEKKLSKFPELSKEIDDFEEYRNKCLSTYKSNI